MTITNEENIINESTGGCFSGIARKLVLIMGECAHVAKDGLNDYHKYKYAWKRTRTDTRSYGARTLNRV